MRRGSFLTMRRVFFGAILAALFGCGLLGLAALPESPRARAAERIAAQARWDERSFARYRLHLRDRRCYQDVEIHHERVVAVHRNSCDRGPRTVSDLFTLIARDNTIGYACIALGCACQDVYAIRAVYDEQFGYPYSIDVKVQSRPNWRHGDYWAYFWKQRWPPDCDVMADGQKTITILALTPLP